jgi:hypothetical protein
MRALSAGHPGGARWVYGLPITRLDAAPIGCEAGTNVRSAEHWMPSGRRNTVDEIETALS